MYLQFIFAYNIKVFVKNQINEQRDFVLQKHRYI